MPSSISNDKLESSVQYYYPFSNQYPVDDVCGRIVLALEKHNWLLPGIKVTFFDIRADSTIYRRVDTIEGHSFKIWFCRRQGIERTLGGYNDSAAVHCINIPLKKLTVHEDESGPDLYVYVGKNWETDREKFVSGNNILSKSQGNPRTYLVYEGAIKKPEDSRSLDRIRGARSPYLVATDKSGTEYSPENDDEPTYYTTNEIFKEFVSYLEGVVKELSPP